MASGYIIIDTVAPLTRQQHRPSPLRIYGALSSVRQRTRPVSDAAIIQFSGSGEFQSRNGCGGAPTRHSVACMLGTHVGVRYEDEIDVSHLCSPAHIQRGDSNPVR